MYLKVERVDADLLLMRREGHVVVTDLGPQPLGFDEFFFFDKMGRKLGRAGYGLRYRNPEFIWWKTLFQPRWLKKAPGPDAQGELARIAPVESVGEAIERLGIAESVHYVLHTTPVVDPWEGEYVFAVTVYKPPKSFTLVEWIKGQPAREAMALRRKAAEIDNAV